jgi:DNA ligase (NAD+)
MTEHILKKITALRQQIQAHNYAYYTLDEPGITDAEYDRQIRSLLALEKQYPSAW